MKDRLFDTSALLNIMLSKKEIASLLRRWSILDLTVYEVGNAVLRLARVQKSITVQQACDLLEYFTLVKQGIRICNVTDVEKVKEISMQSGLSFYDSSYIVATKEGAFTLVTDDEHLSRIASEYDCNVINSKDI